MPEKLKEGEIRRKCPQCSNDTFKILERLNEAQKGIAGRYRVECTICEFKEMAISKNSYGFTDNEHKRGRVKPKPTQDEY